MVMVRVCDKSLFTVSVTGGENNSGKIRTGNVHNLRQRICGADSFGRWTGELRVERGPFRALNCMDFVKKFGEKNCVGCGLMSLLWEILDSPIVVMALS